MGKRSLPLAGVLDSLMEEALARHVFSGAAAGVYRLADGVFHGYWGKTSLFPGNRAVSPPTLFDLASLSKPLATTLAILSLEEQGRLRLDDPLALLLEREVPRDKKNITARHLLNHCAGFAAHRPYFSELSRLAPLLRKEWLGEALLTETLQYQPTEMCLYSDLGFLLLGMIVEQKSGCSLDDYVCSRIMAPIGLGKRILYNPLRQGKNDFAATEICPWRGRMLEGEVHDENTFALNGVAGQSGLFADLEAVLQLVGLLMEMLVGTARHPFFSAEGLRSFCRRQNRVAGSSWALGFDTPTLPGSSAGPTISANSVGHLGYTGTSFWIDLARATAVVLLTNRVHPSRENNQIRQFRPLFHETVFAALDH